MVDECNAAVVATQKTPALSVVIASVNGWDLLGPTIEALDALPERDRLEIVVVEAVGGETRRRLEEHRPEVVVVPVDERLSIPRLRYAGVRKARGDLIAILEDHGAVDPGWARAVLEEHEKPWGAVGGSVENGRQGYVNSAVFFCEYASYMTPVAEGPTDDLPGNNIAYKRPHLLRHAQVLDEGKWESWINDRLRADGVELRSTNRMVVRHIKAFRLGYFLNQRFHFARSYAGMRRAAQDWPARLVYATGSAVLPALLLARIVRRVAAKRRLGQLLACLPLVALFLTVGAAGEMVGYLLGSGRSLERVE
jgi:Glycosyl transferase family 2